MFVQARKYKVGCVIAHQFLDQLEPPSLKSSIMSCTRTKLVGGLNEHDRRKFGLEMDCSPELLSKPKNHAPAVLKTEFACYVRGITDSPTIISVPIGDLEKEPVMDADEIELLTFLNRQQVALTEGEILEEELAKASTEEEEEESVVIVASTGEAVTADSSTPEPKAETKKKHRGRARQHFEIDFASE